MLTSNPAGKILLVDDDTNITDLLSFNLSSEGFEVSVASVARDIDVPSLAPYRLVIADAMCQHYTGIDLCAAIKALPATANLPLILCTARDSEDVIIEAFDAGAEDVIIKPFSLRELIARIKAVLRRHPVKAAAPAASQDEISFPEMDLTITPATQKVVTDNVVLPLTKTEYSILIFLVQNRNSFFTRADICREVWKEDASSNERIVDTNISRLRKKMGQSGKYIINRYGMGYAFVDKVAQ